MGRKFIDGFETGEHDMWDSENNATVISSAGLDMDGDYCLDINSIVKYIQKTITADDEMYFAFLYRGTQVASSLGLLAVANSGTATALIAVCRNATSGTISVRSGAALGSVLVTGTKVLSINATYLIEVRIKIADSGGRVEVKVDGVQDIDFTGDTKPGTDTQFDQVYLGYNSASALTYAYAYYDNVRMDDAAWIGDTKIQAIVPTAGGNSTGWAASAGSNFACVDEIPPSDADYVSVNANNVSDTYVAGDLSGSVDNIKCVQVQSRTKTEGAPTPNNLKLVVRSGGTDYLSGDNAVPAAEKGLSHIWETDPNTAAAWLEAGVNAMEIGIKSAA